MNKYFAKLVWHLVTLYFSWIVIGYGADTCVNKQLSKREITNIVEKMIRDSNNCDLTVFMSPMFLSDSELFSIFLCQLKTNPYLSIIIVDILKELLYQDFPHGRPSVEAWPILEEILQELPDAYGEFKEKFPHALAIPSDEKRAKTNCKLKSDWVTWKPAEIAKAITIRDVTLHLSVDYQEMEKYRRDCCGRSKINEIIDIADKTIFWIRFQLIIAHEKRRAKLVNKLIKVAAELYQMKNIHGLFQIIRALDFDEGNCIDWETKNKNKFKEYNRYKCLLYPENNYLELLELIPEQELRLPVLSTHFKNLFVKTENIQEFNDVTILQFAEQFRKIGTCKQRGKYLFKANEKIIDFFETFPSKSDLQFVNEFLLDPMKPKISDKMLAEELPYGAENFAKDLTKIEAWRAIELLFRGGVFNAKDLLELLSTAKERKGRTNLLLTLGLDEKTASKVSLYAYLGKL